MRKITKWLPWRFAIQKVAQASGFMDPMPLVARLAKFAQPSEVGAPIELLRAGMVFHARGLLNTRAIQSNLDWVWPYWVVRQFDPLDDSFVPRSFSVTHVNLSHRNWTAIGLPGVANYPIVDPRGLVTPFFDGWSVDAWFLDEEGEDIVPSRTLDEDCSQEYGLEEQRLEVRTRIRRRERLLESIAWVEHGPHGPRVHMRWKVDPDARGMLAISIRPANPEGVTEVSELRRRGLHRIEVNRGGSVEFDREAETVRFSDYRHGDVFNRLNDDSGPPREIECEAGMASCALLFPLGTPEGNAVQAVVDLAADPEWHAVAHDSGPVRTWEEELAPAAKLSVPDERIRMIYDNAIVSMILHAPEDVYPGPFTYKRFWYRDAVLILNAMLSVNLVERSEHVMERLPKRQLRRTGYYRSQEGEWDSNGQVLWLFRRWQELTGKPMPPQWLDSAHRGAEWIRNKRLPKEGRELQAGLLPAGFSAEHLGNNDYYLWDDFWAVGGLRAAARMLREADDPSSARRYHREAEDLARCIERAVARSEERRGRPAYPAAPHRRMDAGAIGSIVAGYPLQIVAPDDERLLDTAEYLMGECLVEDGFFQNMIHSGINAYLTIHIAQVLMRAGDRRFERLVRAIERLASPTGQWPEAINPRTGGGCMGDGHHVWACAEWAMMLRNMFVREEGNALVIGEGILAEWLDQREPLSFGPTPTPFGTVSVRVEPLEDSVRVQIDGAWREPHPTLHIRLVGTAPVEVAATDATEVMIARERHDAPETATSEVPSQ